MSKGVYRTAQGKAINMDALRLANESTIAIGNMKTNARGDELGPGGVVVRTRNELVGEYYSSNAVYTKERVEEQRQDAQATRNNTPRTVQIEPDEMPVTLDPSIEEQDQLMDSKPQLRGKLADAVAKTAQVDQKVIQPRTRRSEGMKRI